MPPLVFIFKMATIYNSDLTKELIDAAKLQISRDSVPNQIADKVVPVMEVNPKLFRRINRIFSSSKSTTGTLTVGTVDSDRDTFVVGFNVSVIKDVTCDLATGPLALTVTSNNLAMNIARLETITLTAQNYNLYFSLPIPIKVDRGTAITMNGTFNAGVLQRGASVHCYTIENSTA